MRRAWALSRAPFGRRAASLRGSRAPSLHTRLGRSRGHGCAALSLLLVAEPYFVLQTWHWNNRRKVQEFYAQK